jgi:hypothetical protein
VTIANFAVVAFQERRFCFGKRKKGVAMTALETVAVVAGQLYTPEETAAYLKLGVKTLEVWRATGRYPKLKSTKAGAAVRYRGEDILAFVNGEHEPAAPYVPKSRRPKLLPRRARKRRAA